MSYVELFDFLKDTYQACIQKRLAHQEALLNPSQADDKRDHDQIVYRCDTKLRKRFTFLHKTPSWQNHAVGGSCR
jgi:hypothetical protein